MRCRAIKYDNNDKHVVWFGSYGKNEDGTAKKYSNDNNSYSTKQQAIVDSLTQQLSVLKNELWYNVNAGLPLIDKNKSKIPIDSAIASIITQHKDVVAIKSFSSKLVDKKYIADIKIISRYGEITLNL